MTAEDKEKFYRECAEQLGTQRVALGETGPVEQQGAGNGRFPGCGVIRYFGPNLIKVALKLASRSLRVVKDSTGLMASA
ncbi:hypothetical protein LAC81_34735 (plasmid) [Ensifer adhaerens]|uniref:hypothetical protein n=1 Tax=Ensifer adhaerens TaxID=106592 RepID=UPI001CBD298E|nr:hypothetical protein [Ensifer adhaerens]MBZ7927116.1 hypothetical protein [Ensifer adhaerens]UAX98158.1 hypothetical protein LAC78_36035 [Ensifer adhaerens]UAY05540.1 hypothetical protein LAC80_34740 [Ensifer adhaerens]UAY12918.1 hypothetical protein LAC81_34735 [Ensifer adhaerens]